MVPGLLAGIVICWHIGMDIGWQGVRVIEWQVAGL